MIVTLLKVVVQAKSLKVAFLKWPFLKEERICCKMVYYTLYFGFNLISANRQKLRWNCKYADEKTIEKSLALKGLIFVKFL